MKVAFFHTKSDAWEMLNKYIPLWWYKKGNFKQNNNHLICSWFYSEVSVCFNLISKRTKSLENIIVAFNERSQIFLSSYNVFIWDDCPNYVSKDVFWLCAIWYMIHHKVKVILPLFNAKTDCVVMFITFQMLGKSTHVNALIEIIILIWSVKLRR